MLCQSQVALLTEGLGASLSVVYLTEELIEGEQAKWVPIIAYPESPGTWTADLTLELLPELESESLPAKQLTAADSGMASLAIAIQEFQSDRLPDSGVLTQQRQMVFPLIHESDVMGLLVTGREDRPWNPQEVTQIEQIAHTLALACILDRRRAWLTQQLTQTQLHHAQHYELLDNLLHQIRSPLTALRTFGKLLLKRLLPGDGNRDVASNILRESDRVQELLQQMDQTLDRAQIVDVGNLRSPLLEPLSPQFLLPGSVVESCCVPEILEPLLTSANAIAAERELDLHLEMPDKLPLVQSNPKALREVLSNLIDNALKYTPAGGEILIQVGEITPSSGLNPTGAVPPPQLAIAISDTGPGIPPEDLQHLFERHYRGVQAHSEIPGTGLGLAIARDLLSQMKGEIQVFSPAIPLTLTRGKILQRQPQLGFQSTLDTHSLPGTTFLIGLPLDGEPEPLTSRKTN